MRLYVCYGILCQHGNLSILAGRITMPDLQDGSLKEVCREE